MATTGNGTQRQPTTGNCGKIADYVRDLFIMPTGSLTLADYPADMVRLACTRCDRHGQYRKAVLVARYGQDKPLPDLRLDIAQCPNAGRLGTACGVYFVDLSIAKE